MNESYDERTTEFYARTYDVSVPDWPGEIDFYQTLADEARRDGENVLEIACGTGRIAVRLARSGVNVLGLDRAPNMLSVAREKSVDLPNMRWVQADMRSFDLGEQFGLAFIAGHSFQNLNTPEDQVACLECIQRHLKPGGRLVVHLDHQDLAWLGGLTGEKGGVFEFTRQFHHPDSGCLVRASKAWWVEPSTQSALVQTAWEELDENGQVTRLWKTLPIRLHCLFRFEMAHLLARTGFAVEALYGDFYRHPLDDKSDSMIWVAKFTIISP
jgi:SAM-dependent methyltransferase